MRLLKIENGTFWQNVVLHLYAQKPEKRQFGDLIFQAQSCSVVLQMHSPEQLGALRRLVKFEPWRWLQRPGADPPKMAFLPFLGKYLQNWFFLKKKVQIWGFAVFSSSESGLNRFSGVDLPPSRTRRRKLKRSVPDGSVSQNLENEPSLRALYGLL